MATYDLPPDDPTAELTTIPLGPDGDHCRECRAPLARDQRYCLACGRARTEARVELESLYAPAGMTETVTEAAPPPLPPPPRRPFFAIAALAGALAAFAVGLLCGLLAKGDPPAPVVAAQKPPVVNVSVPAAPAAGTAPAATVTPDWPADQTGWTVQLECLPKEGTTPDAVNAAKSGATAKGASAPGIVDTDMFASLEPGQWCVYDGVYDTKKEAKAAATDLQDGYPSADAVKVSTDGADSAGAADKDTQKLDKSDLEKQQNASPDEFQKNSKKLDKAATEGAPPPTDNVKPGGGDEGQTFE